MSIANPSITYLITTIGEPTLKNTLRSLYGQFNWEVDQIKILFDGKGNPDDFNEEYELYQSKRVDCLEVDYLPVNSGFWGHKIRNSFQFECDTDYIHHMDSDDEYFPAILHKVRDDMKGNYGKVLIYKVHADGGIVPFENKLVQNCICTPSGFIPNRKEIFGEFGLYYGGDYQYYKQIEDKIGKENFVYFPNLLVKTKVYQRGW